MTSSEILSVNCRQSFGIGENNLEYVKAQFLPICQYVVTCVYNGRSSLVLYTIRFYHNYLTGGLFHFYFKPAAGSLTVTVLFRRKFFIASIGGVCVCLCVCFFLVT